MTEKFKFVPAKFPNTELKNHLDDFSKRVENASGEDQFAFLTSIVGNAFEQNNKSREGKGDAPYSKKQYVDVYIQTQQGSIKSKEEIIAHEQEGIKRLEEQLSVDGEGEEVKKLKQILRTGFGGSGNEFGLGKEKIDEVVSLLDYYKDKYDQDNLLDQLYDALKYIQLQKESIELYKKLIEKISKLKPVTE